MKNDTVSEKVNEAVQGTDEPISAKRPATPFSLVLGAYPIALVVILLILLVIYSFFR